MSRFVLDASAILPTAFEDEASEYADAIFLALAYGEEAHTTAIWPLEIANALRQAQRRNRIGPEGIGKFIPDLWTYPIEIVPATVVSLPRILEVARDSSLSVYDAAYLQLAISTKAPLATRDDQLLAAATAREVPTYTPASG